MIWKYWESWISTEELGKTLEGHLPVSSVAIPCPFMLAHPEALEMVALPPLRVPPVVPTLMALMFNPEVPFMRMDSNTPDWGGLPKDMCNTHQTTLWKYGDSSAMNDNTFVGYLPPSWFVGVYSAPGANMPNAFPVRWSPDMGAFLAYVR
jgi:hypothetical protein